MDGNERQVIDELFGKLRQLDQQAPQRDAEAEAHIRQQVAAMPAAPYYMAQAILVQELERAATERPAAGGFLGGLFGGGQPAARCPGGLHGGWDGGLQGRVAGAGIVIADDRGTRCE